MDQIDKANDRALLENEWAILSVRPSDPLVCGSCHWCESICDSSFCDAECRDFYDRRQKMNKIEGK